MGDTYPYLRGTREWTTDHKCYSQAYILWIDLPSGSHFTMSPRPHKRQKLTTNSPAPRSYKYVTESSVKVPASLRASCQNNGQWYQKNVVTGQWTPVSFPQRCLTASARAIDALHVVMGSHLFGENRVLEECLHRTNRLLRGACRSREALRAQCNHLRSQNAIEIQARVFWESLCVDMVALSPACADLMRTRLEEFNRLHTEEILDESTEDEETS